MPTCNIVVDVSLSMMVSEEKVSPYMEALELCTTLLGLGLENFPDQKFKVVCWPVYSLSLSVMIF